VRSLSGGAERPKVFSLLRNDGAARVVQDPAPAVLRATTYTLASLFFWSAVARADDATVAPHPDAPWWLSGQINLIAQAQPGFHSPYHSDGDPTCPVGTGESCGSSLLPDDHLAASFVVTVFAGYAVTSTTAIVVAPESAGGSALSTGVGLAGFTNIDIVRNPSLSSVPYVARAFVDQIIPLSDDWVDVDHGPLRPFRRVPKQRLQIRAGKMSTAESFDLNAVGSDSHYQFINWTVDNNGAWDYAADTRGYTLGAIVEYADPTWAVRFGELLMPTYANGTHYDFDLANARGQNLEVEHHQIIGGRPGIVRVLGYWNLAEMGNYDEANAQAKAAGVPAEVRFTREQGRSKVGFGVNVEQELTDEMRGFLRLGWNDGRNESFAYTEVDDTIVVGIDLRGTSWHRSGDKLGLAAVSNGISDGHREYLALGGHGFLLGDGRLHYGREDIVEAYYTLGAIHGISPAIDLQLVDHPGYNTDRGPVFVGSLRLHVEL
jgi:hypothetical protein